MSHIVDKVKIELNVNTASDSVHRSVIYEVMHMEKAVARISSTGYRGCLCGGNRPGNL